MKPIKLIIKGVTTFETETEINFEIMNNFFAITGENGSGKSSIFAALTYALFGGKETTSKGITFAKLTSSDDASVLLEFEHRHQRYQVYRAAKKSGSFLSRLNKNKEWEALVERKEIEINDAIENILGLNSDLFSKTILIPQNKFGEVITQSGQARRQNFQSLAKNDIFNIVKEKANDKQIGFSQVLKSKQDQKKQLLIDIGINENTNEENSDSIKINDLDQIIKSRIKSTKEIDSYAESQKKDLINLRDLEATVGEYHNALEREKSKESEIKATQREVTNKKKETKELDIEITKLTETLDNIDYLPGSKKILEALIKKNQLEEKINELQNNFFRKESTISTKNNQNLVTKFEGNITTIEIEMRRMISYMSHTVKSHQSTIEAMKYLIPKIKQKNNEELLLKKLENDFQNNALTTIINKLKKGDLCPICGEKINDINKLHTANKNAMVSQDDLKKQREKCSDISIEVSKLKQKIQDGSNIDVKELTNMIALDTQETLQAESNEYIKIGKDLKEFMNTYNIDKSTTTDGWETYETLNIKKLKAHLKEKISEYNNAQVTIDNIKKLHEANENLKTINDEVLKPNLAIIKKLQQSNLTIEEQISHNHINEKLYDTTNDNIIDVSNKKKELEDSLLRKKGELDAEIKQANKYKIETEKKQTSIIKQAQAIQVIPKQQFNSIINLQLETMIQSIENNIKEKDDEKRKNTKAIESAEKTKNIIQETLELESSYELYEEINKEMTASEFPNYKLNRIMNDILILTTQILNHSLSSPVDVIEADEKGNLLFYTDGSETPKEVNNLSGGEQFVVSLAFILSIAEYISNQQATDQYMSFESLMIDEGIDSLDDSNLDIVIQALEELSQEKMVAIITHMNEIEDKVPMTLKVKKGKSNKIEILSNA